MRRELNPPVDPEFWEDLESAMLESAKVIMREQQVVDVSDKNEASVINDEDENESSQEDTFTPHPNLARSLSTRSMKSALASKMLLLAGLNQASAFNFDQPSPFDTHLRPNIGYKIPKKYSPGASKTKNVSFKKKKKASKVSAKSKSNNRK